MIKLLIDESKYSVKCPYSMIPEGIAIHNTANDASARNEVAYMGRNNNQVSFHIAVDDKEAIQAIEFDRNAWHAGDGGTGTGNRKYIAVEICYSKSGGNKFLAAERNAAKVVADLLKLYGWGTEKIKAHRDFSGKNCPHRTDMNSFKTLVSNYLEINSNEIYRVRTDWEDISSQKGAFTNLDNAINCAQKNQGYYVFNSQGRVIGQNTIAIGSKVRIIGNYYATGEKISEWAKKKLHTVSQINGDRALLKEIISWCYIKDLD